jgi:hypothetical protein
VKSRVHETLSQSGSPSQLGDRPQVRDLLALRIDHPGMLSLPQSEPAPGLGAG